MLTLHFGIWICHLDALHQLCPRWLLCLHSPSSCLYQPLDDTVIGLHPGAQMEFDIL